MEIGVDWGVFMAHSLAAAAPSGVTSNQIVQVRTDDGRRDARGKSRFDGRFRIPRRGDVDFELKIASSASKI